MNEIVNVILWATYFIALYFAVFWMLVFLDTGDEKIKSRKFKEWPYVTIAIPAYNAGKSIKDTLLSITELDYPKEKLEIFVIDDGSTDNTKDEAMRVARKHKYIKIITHHGNMGKGAGLNSALDTARGEFFVCLDADSYVNKDALKKLLTHFTSEDIACVLPALKVLQPKNMLQKMQWYEYLINMFYKELMSRLDCVHVAPGPFSVYRKDIIEKVGRFDADRNLTEDLEIALRLQSFNYKLVQVLDVDVYTIAPSRLKELYNQRNRWYKGSIINAIKYKRMMFNKNYGDFGFIQMPTIIISGIIALIAITTLTYYSLKPYVEYFINISYVNFDVWTLIKNFHFNFNILDLNYTTILVAAIMLLVTVFVISKSHKETKEEALKHGILSLILYILFYFLLLGVMWVGISIDLIRGRRQGW